MTDTSDATPRPDNMPEIKFGVWAEEAGIRLAVTRHSNGSFVVEITDDDKTIAAATITTWRWRNLMTVMSHAQPIKMLQPEGWHSDMEAAPKDGTQILACAAGQRRIVDYDAQWGWRTIPGHYSFRPTRWALLPSTPPAEDKTNG